ncbi:MAG: hypothetical protein U0787_04810 [Polyangia bacterium]
MFAEQRASVIFAPSAAVVCDQAAARRLDFAIDIGLLGDGSPSQVEHFQDLAKKKHLVGEDHHFVHRRAGLGEGACCRKPHWPVSVLF